MILEKIRRKIRERRNSKKAHKKLANEIPFILNTLYKVQIENEKYTLETRRNREQLQKQIHKRKSWQEYIS